MLAIVVVSLLALLLLELLLFELLLLPELLLLLSLSLGMADIVVCRRCIVAKKGEKSAMREMLRTCPVLRFVVCGCNGVWGWNCESVLWGE